MVTFTEEILNRKLNFLRSAPKSFSTKCVLKNLAEFIENTCATVSFLIMLQAPGLSFIKKRFWLRRFPKFLRIAFYRFFTERFFLYKNLWKFATTGDVW